MFYTTACDVSIYTYYLLYRTHQYFCDLTSKLQIPQLLKNTNNRERRQPEPDMVTKTRVLRRQNFFSRNLFETLAVNKEK